MKQLCDIYQQLQISGIVSHDPQEALIEIIGSLVITGVMMATTLTRDIATLRRGNPAQAA